jgi:hypothetical protein
VGAGEGAVAWSDLISMVKWPPFRNPLVSALLGKHLQWGGWTGEVSQVVKRLPSKALSSNPRLTH